MSDDDMPLDVEIVMSMTMHFILELVEEIADEMGDIEYISSEAIDTEVRMELTKVAKFIWASYVKDRDTPS